MSDIPPASGGVIGKVLCYFGRHQVEVATGWTEYFDGKAENDYYITIYCGRCNRVIDGGPK